MRWLLMAVLCFGFSGLNALADEPLPRTISTTGEATVNVVPDEVVIPLGVQVFERDLDTAESGLTKACGQLVGAIRGMGIEERQIQTQDMELDLRYKDTQYSVGIDGYLARRQYSITLKDTKQLEKLIDTALHNGANHLFGIEYRTTALRRHRDEARRLAIRAAREKAQALAAELGCEIGKPRTIGESSWSYSGGWGSRWGLNQYNAMAQNVIQQGPGGQAEAGESLPLGQIAIRAQINVVFDLIPR
jgi:uncharacterized protein YggE